MDELRDRQFREQLTDLIMGALSDQVTPSVVVGCLLGALEALTGTEIELTEEDAMTGQNEIWLH